MKTPIIILSGFLGTGKTTLMQYLISQFPDKKVAILVNDFGEVPVDATLLSKKGLPKEMLYEVSGGSIFCACLKDNFLIGLKALCEVKPDLIVVEASGMADPSGISPMIRQAGLSDQLTLMCTLCVFDAIKSMKLAANLDTIVRQVRGSHYILLNKTDLATPQELAKAQTWLTKTNASARVFETVQCRFDTTELAQQMENPFALMPSLNTEGNRPDTFTVKSINGRIEDFISALEKEEALLRVKGCLTQNEQHWYLSDTGRGIEVTPSDAYISPVVIITLQGQGNALKENLIKKGFLSPS